MHFPNQIVLGLRKFLDPLRHVVQFLQHRFLPRREPMHPPKTNAPAGRADPGQDERYRLDIELHLHSGTGLA
jgi:hypothetical protein